MAESTGVAARVAALAAPLAAEHGVELVDVDYVKEGGRWCLRLYIDKPDGIGLDDCEAVSNLISPFLDEHDIIPHSYHLEVSSLGLERPLRKASDYERFQGRLVKLAAFAAIGGRKRFTGILSGHDAQAVHLEVEGRAVAIPWSNVAGCRLVFEPGGSAGGSLHNEY